MERYIIKFPLYLFNKCKLREGIDAIKIIERNNILACRIPSFNGNTVNWYDISNMILNIKNYNKFDKKSKFTEYILFKTYGIHYKIALSGNLEKELEKLSNYYSLYRLTYEEYLLFFEIFVQIIVNAVENIKQNNENEFNLSVFIPISYISNLYPKTINIKDKIEKFKEDFHAFFHYNELGILNYTVLEIRQKSTLELKFSDVTK